MPWEWIYLLTTKWIMMNSCLWLFFSHLRIFAILALFGSTFVAFYMVAESGIHGFADANYAATYQWVFYKKDPLYLVIISQWKPTSILDCPVRNISLEYHLVQGFNTSSAFRTNKNYFAYIMWQARKGLRDTDSGYLLRRFKYSVHIRRPCNADGGVLFGLLAT